MEYRITDTVTRIKKLFDDVVVLSILESKDNYIVSVCSDEDSMDTALDNIHAVNKATFKVSEFSYFAKPEEYTEACNNVIYRHEKLK